MYIDRTYIMYLAVPLARADRIQTGIQSVIYMKGQDLGTCDIDILCFYLKAFGYFNFRLL